RPAAYSNRLLREATTSGSEDPRFHHAEEVSLDQLHRPADLLVSMIKVPRIVEGTAFLHLLRRQAEDEDIILADLFEDLHVGTIERADGHGPVKLQLHVAGAGRLGAGERDLLA